jgi:hypothetical protein
MNFHEKLNSHRGRPGDKVWREGGEVLVDGEKTAGESDVLVLRQSLR